LTDGFKTLLFFDGDNFVFEKEVTPPGWDGGGPNDITVMENTALRTFYPKKLITLTEAGIVCQYFSETLTELAAVMNVNQDVECLYSDGGSVVFWGWVDKWIPHPIKEGEPPLADLKIHPSNVNASLVETLPVYTAP
jgi:hypothetical protein